MPRNLAIIPVRTGSKRLPQKNLLKFCGKPLFAHAISCSLEAECFDEIHVSTEDPGVLASSREFGAGVGFLRPSHLADDDATLQQVCEFVIAEYERKGFEFDCFCIVWATAPLRTAEDILEGYGLLSEDIDAVIGVTHYDLPLYCAQEIDREGVLQPIFPKMLRKPANEMPKVVCDNGSFCWVRTSSFKKYGTWLPPKIRGYVMPRSRSVDLDTEEDWQNLLFLHQRQLDE